MSYTILVLGGYGTFGSRISRSLAALAGVRLLVAGRNGKKADLFAESLRQERPGAIVESVLLDHQGPELTKVLKHEAVDLVVHAAGPFQGQDYHVAEACISRGVNYVDMADDRVFVTGISALDPRAREAGCLIVSGASTLPGLSAAVIDAHLPEFSRLEAIDHGITPGNKADRGLATVHAFLSYCGTAFTRLEDDRWVTVYGWQDLHRRHYPEIGPRWLSACEVPDLTLFHERYPQLRSIVFQAGLEMSVLHLGIWLASWMRKLGLVKDWTRYARPMTRMSEWLRNRGTDAGAMHVEMTGTGKDGLPLRRVWHLIARAGDGPQIPCVSAILVARKLARGELTQAGATACMGLFTLQEFTAQLKGLNIRQVLQ